MTARADFASQDYFRDPGAAIEKLRSLGPVVEVRFPIIGKVWTTSTQALADQVLKDTATFTMRKDDGDVAGFQWWMPGIVRTLATSMLSMDEPDHKRLRDIVDEAFRRRAVLDMEPHIQAIGDELADQLFAEGRPADLVERYARKLPLSVISELLGLPLADRAKFTAWAGGFTRFTGALAFGTGIHFCLGHQLARIEGRCTEISIPALARADARGGSIGNYMAQTARPQGDRPPASRAGKPRSRIGGRSIGAANVRVDEPVRIATCAARQI